MSAMLRFVISAYALIAIVGGLFYWIFRPVETAPLDQLRTAASFLGFLVAIAIGSGIAAMATVQFWKVLFLPRSSFHEYELRALFGEEAFDLLALVAPGTKGELYYSNRGQMTSLLDNPTEIVMGQLRSVADYVLIRPDGFERVLFRLAGDVGSKAVDSYLSNRLQQRDSQEPDVGRVNDALVEVRFFVEQRLNIVHVSLKERWRRRVRLVAVAVAGSSGFLVAGVSNLSPAPRLSAVVAAVVWGGFFSWLSRDVVAIIERRRS
jgi:hypothetical protein